MPKPEQTEKATPKRRSESRRKGQVARSQELGGAVVFLSAIIVLHLYGSATLNGLHRTARADLVNAISAHDFTIFSVWSVFAQTFGGFGLVLVVLFGVAVVVGLLANLLQFGFIFTLKPITPTFTKLNPLTGIQRFFSKQILVNLGKQLIKLAAVMILLYGVIFNNSGMFAEAGGMLPAQVFALLGGVIYDIGWKFGVFLVIVGLIDYAYERYQLEQNLKMTKQEVKDEYRQAEGNPEVRGQVKRRQRESARRRMMSSVPRATVVVTNPTHYAVALEWDEIQMEAPVVTAKGADLVAKRIRDLAREHGVPVLENPPLARTLYERVELDQSVPPHLYSAVAQVIAFVYRLKRKTIA